MALLINIPNRPLDKLITRLNVDLAKKDIVIWPDGKHDPSIKFALVWKHQSGTLADYPALEGLSSFGAGVDSILSDPELPNVPIARIVDPNLANNMAQYVVAQILNHKLRLPQFSEQQNESRWKPKSPRRVNRVGILGLGQLGATTAALLNAHQFEVMGWSRTEKRLKGVTCFSGAAGLNHMLANSDYLVCLLPLTKDTENILDAKRLSQLPQGAVVINVARGNHVVDEELIEMLDIGHLDAAVLDVFRQEPLESAHPFWRHPKVTITPHISAVTNVETAVNQIIENYQRVMAGRPMVNCIDREAGY